MALAEQSLAPCTPQAMSVGLAKLLEFARAFGLTDADRDQTRTILEMYKKALGHLPGDLVVKAAERAVTHWKWGNRMPLPADLLELVSEDMAKRHHVRLKLTTALAKARREANSAKPPMTDEMRRKAQELLDNRKRNLTMAG
jgi:hypothetical protein